MDLESLQLEKLSGQPADMQIQQMDGKKVLQAIQDRDRVSLTELMKQEKLFVRDIKTEQILLKLLLQVE